MSTNVLERVSPETQHLQSLYQRAMRSYVEATWSYRQLTDSPEPHSYLAERRHEVELLEAETTVARRWARCLRLDLRIKRLALRHAEGRLT